MRSFKNRKLQKSIGEIWTGISAWNLDQKIEQLFIIIFAKNTVVNN